MSLRAICPRHPAYDADCDDCRDHARRYKRRQYAGRRDGTWEQLVQGEELEGVRAHVQRLLAIPGSSGPLLASLLGLGSSTLYKLVNGKHVYLWPGTARTIVGLSERRVRSAIEPRQAPLVGVSRRLQALACDGWDAKTLSALTGLNRVSIGKWRSGTHYRTINVEARDRLVEVYDKIQGLADPSGPDAQTATRALRLGYLPAERWDEAMIDDPDAQPLPLVLDAPDPVELRQQVQQALRLRTPGAGSGWAREVKRRLAVQARQDGWPIAEVAQVLGMSTSGVEYLLNGRKDRPHTRQR